MSLNNTQDNEKIELITEFMCEKIDKPHYSSFDLFQKILFMVQLSKRDKLAQIIADYKRTDPSIEPSSEELHEYAITALAKVIPMDLFNKYTEILTQDLFKKVNGLFPEWEKEFHKCCLQAEKLKMYEGKIPN